MNKPIPFGNYFLLERINVGGMAEVFRAKQFGVEGFERLVAVKRILPNIAEDKDFIEMFIDEAKISVQLNHANIAQVFNLGHEDGSYFIALEHIHGRDLRAIFERNRNQGEPMPVPQACFVSMKMCEGLDYAHNKRDESGNELSLVHRDVSPQNIIVSFDGEVKLIDFGIAKAAGKGSQTQAGILKGKFGYMSPEQVRGLPVDRRSDVFACGIVLYELLTGERLFVGESDFSTLEKVRNVEILPPSTYNRKIQPELERIVLKALAKDVEDRYQNAIDLHDELQAYVYTSGEFYSRKDLSTWMRRVWAKEIKDEEKRIASYRDMAPPVRIKSGSDGAEVTRSGKTSKKKTNPPPIPSRRSPTSSPPPFRQNQEEGKAKKGEGLEWDDDELETSIYDEDPNDIDVSPTSPALINSASLAASEKNQDREKTKNETPSRGLKAAALSRSALATETKVPLEEPDLSTLVSSQAWDEPKTNSPGRVADGSNKTKTPFSLDSDPSNRESEVAAMSNLTGVKNSAFGANLTPQNDRRSTWAIVALLSICAIGAIVYFMNRDGAEPIVAIEVPTHEVDTGVAAVAPVEKKVPIVPLSEKDTGRAEKTGFDLIVDPHGVKVSLNGEFIGKSPLQIRSIAEGEHTVDIEAPPGFFSKQQQIIVIGGKASEVKIALDSLKIEGVFLTDPTGAKVEIVIDGISKSLGVSPTKFDLDPRKNYEVIFTKQGYDRASQVIKISGSPKEMISMSLEKTKHVFVEPKPVKHNTANRPHSVPLNNTKPPEVKVSREPGTLLISSKPPCQIFIDGKDIGKKTPQRNISLLPGKHRITLINKEHGIKRNFSVRIKPANSTKLIKDLRSNTMSKDK